MIRNIASISAAGLVAGALAFGPLVARATPRGVSSAPARVAVTVVVPPTMSISATMPALSTAWDGSAAQAVPFRVTAKTNDPGGYQFTFSGTTLATFQLDGTGGNAVTIPYSIKGTDVDGPVYVSGIQGNVTYPGSTRDEGVTSTFNVDLPLQANVPADSYTDTLSVAITTVTLT